MAYRCDWSFLKSKETICFVVVWSLSLGLPFSFPPTLQTPSPPCLVLLLCLFGIWEKMRRDLSTQISNTTTSVLFCERMNECSTWWDFVQIELNYLVFRQPTSNKRSPIQPTNRSRLVVRICYSVRCVVFASHEKQECWVNCCTSVASPHFGLRYTVARAPPWVYAKCLRKVYVFVWTPSPPPKSVPRIGNRPFVCRGLD